MLLISTGGIPAAPVGGILPVAASLSRGASLPRVNRNIVCLDLHLTLAIAITPGLPPAAIRNHCAVTFPHR
jgi:hypothetical protein